MKNRKPTGFSHNWLKKIRARVFLMLPSILGALLCMMSLTSTSWAFFSCKIQSSYMLVVSENWQAQNALEEEIIEEFARAYDLDPDDVVMMGEEGIEMIGDFITINWPGIPAGRTYMSSGFSQVEGDTVSIMTVGSPSDIKYQMGIKDPHQVMRYVEGNGTLQHDFSIKIKGRHYFFVTNLDSSRVLDAQATIIR